ncbi:MAG TPA: sugar ABC transporter substrate-binding protein [Candidatus Gastranaerophilaceae bacterium]|nr:sugar ABC transporter substrate-binding protein [Candidatus Gastranaerophilaceae bacterium]
MKFKYFLILFFSIFLISGCTKQPQKTVIKFSSWGSQSEIAIIKPILAAFEKENPDIKVEFMHIPQNYFQKLHLLFASNLAPDVIFINNLYLPIYADANLLDTLNGKIDENLFYKKALDVLSYNNKLYAIPRDVSNLFFYINKNIFDRYNVPYPSKYWSFNDFLILAKKTTKDTNNDGKTDIWGVSFEEDLFFYLPYLMSEGGGVLSDNLKHLIIDTPQSQKGLHFYADLRNKYNVAPRKSESASATMAQLFLQGKLAMHLSGRWLVPKYRQEAKFNWGVINFPKGDKGSIVPMDASGWAISKSSKHKQEALRLIEYLSSKKSIEKMTQSGLIVPARIDVAHGEFLQDKNSPYNKTFVEVIKTSKKTPVSIKYSEIQDDLKEKTEYLFNQIK